MVSQGYWNRLSATVVGNDLGSALPPQTSPEIPLGGYANPDYPFMASPIRLPSQIPIMKIIFHFGGHSIYHLCFF